jgi:Rrf2 family protein
MRMSTRARYGLRFVLDVALHARDGKSVSLKDVAKRQDISPKYLWQVVAPLKAAGLIRVLRGARGGYAVARKPESITLRDIFSVLEGNCFLVECTESPRGCPRSGDCVARTVWQELEEKIVEAMESITLQDMIDKSSAGEKDIALDYTI